MNTPGAEEMIRTAMEEYGDHLNIGAGTVCTTRELATALDAGAAFIVTPVVDKTVIRRCARKGVPVFPGAYTPTEIFTAVKYGADIVKIFPATALGPAFIRNLQGPLPHIRLLPTGGIDLDNCIDFLAAGAAGLGIGNKLFDTALIKAGQWPLLEQKFRQYADRISSFLAERPTGERGRAGCLQER
jgi:2-dehydro-3-deoxyphosphogluconate aldolase/(4S)-4-hydroxy-2-oxoglutarate aldolase